MRNNQYLLMNIYFLARKVDGSCYNKTEKSHNNIYNLQNSLRISVSKKYIVPCIRKCVTL